MREKGGGLGVPNPSAKRRTAALLLLEALVELQSEEQSAAEASNGNPPFSYRLPAHGQRTAAALSAHTIWIRRSRGGHSRCRVLSSHTRAYRHHSPVAAHHV